MVCPANVTTLVLLQNRDDNNDDNNDEDNDNEDRKGEDNKGKTIGFKDGLSSYPTKPCLTYICT